MYDDYAKENPVRKDDPNIQAIINMLNDLEKKIDLLMLNAQLYCACGRAFAKPYNDFTKCECGISFKQLYDHNADVGKKVLNN